jgi:hypothetical protein
VGKWYLYTHGVFIFLRKRALKVVYSNQKSTKSYLYTHGVFIFLRKRALKVVYSNQKSTMQLPEACMVQKGFLYSIIKEKDTLSSSI